MSFQYIFVFSILLIELALVGILLIPLPRAVRRVALGVFIAGMSNWRIAGGGKERQALGSKVSAWMLQGALFLVSIFFLDSLQKSFKLQTFKDNLEKNALIESVVNTIQFRSELGSVHAKLFYAQRNVYLTGLVLVLFILLKLLASLLQTKIILEEKIESVCAKNVQLEEERSALEKQNELLSSRLDELTISKAKAVDALLKQVQQQEYRQLSEIYDSLEKLEQ